MSDVNVNIRFLISEHLHWDHDSIQTLIEKLLDKWLLFVAVWMYSDQNWASLIIYYSRDQTSEMLMLKCTQT